MTPQTYLEFDTDLQLALFHEWSGREYCRSVDPNGTLGYPMAPDPWIPPPANPPPEAFTRTYFADPKPKPGGGGVFTLDDDSLVFCTQEQTLSDGRVFTYDIAANAKTLEQLSEAGQVAITSA